MATITPRENAKGETRYTAKVRLKGFEPCARTFATYGEAGKWQELAEYNLQHGLQPPGLTQRRKKGTEPAQPSNAGGYGKSGAVVRANGSQPAENPPVAPQATPTAPRANGRASGKTSELKTFRDILQRYLERVVPTHKGKAEEALRSERWFHGKLPFVNTPIAELHLEQIEDYVEHRQKTVKNGTALWELNLLYSALNRAKIFAKLSGMRSMKAPANRARGKTLNKTNQGLSALDGRTSG